MTINTINKDIVMATDPIVGHCCNTQNTMGNGVAAALRARFPEIYEADVAAYITIGSKDLLGRCILVPVETDPSLTQIKYIANMYGQPNYGYIGRYVDYEAIYQSLEALCKHTQNLGFTSVALPHRLASDRAGGHWSIIQEMIKHVFNDTLITINLHRI
jgi:O-acetyl-ADP-ribose deacetylase (regulator of RNase III)